MRTGGHVSTAKKALKTLRKHPQTPAESTRPRTDHVIASGRYWDSDLKHLPGQHVALSAALSL
ncbi:hypothetical protein EV384_0891 [Micromonospora kangleipakensis]|uniref:Uncharacterized protein n=1 Tax=Micromonospora kangleipakensis TaxID=1077942 RepID=A0A4Q8B4N3_9ACTN|nr:hypothetical protein EV384_0891 [Micromonospora kangleipakensis]